MARQRRVSRETAARRKRIWARTVESALVVPASGAKLVVDLGEQFSLEYGTTHLPVGSTVGGVLLDVAVSRGGAIGVVSPEIIQHGLIVTNETVFSDVPSPIGDKHADWMYWNMITCEHNAELVTSTWETLGSPLRVRSKRRIDELGMSLFWVAESSGTADYTVALSASVLMLLP